MSVRADRDRWAHPWLARHSVDLAFAGLLAVAFGHLLSITRDGYFYGDDWGLIRQAGSLPGFVRPYNDHLSLTILAVYRGVVELFGFTYGPLRTIGLLCLMAVPVTLYLTTRRALGPPLAAVVALTTLWFAKVEVRPATLNHYLVLVGAIVCAAALERGRRADLPLAAALSLALSSTGGGVAVATACVVHCVCTRPHRRRWLAVVGPSCLWALWWLIAARGHESQFRAGVAERRAVTLPQALRYARKVAWTPFEHLGLGSPLLAALLAAAFVGYGIWRLRQGTDHAASFLGWTSAFVMWSIGISYTRGELAVGEGSTQTGDVDFRYQLVALVFALLAVVPHRSVRWGARGRGTTRRQWLVAGAVAVLVIGWTGEVTVRERVDSRAAAWVRTAWNTKRSILDLELENPTIDDGATLPGPAFFGLRAAEVRALVARYGRPTLVTTPSAPSILRTAVAGSRTATVSWTAATSDGGSPITGYVVTPYVGYTPMPAQSFDSTATTQVLTGLTDGTTYRFRVQAVNAIGAGPPSKVTNPVTPTAPADRTT